MKRVERRQWDYQWKLQWSPPEIKKLELPGDPMCCKRSCTKPVTYRMSYQAPVFSKVGGVRVKFLCDDHVHDEEVIWEHRVKKDSRASKIK